MRVFFLSCLLLISTAAAPAESHAQSSSGEGEAILTQWPRETGTPLPERYPFALLPFIDVLTLDYRYRVEDGLPAMDFSVAWTPGLHGILDHKKVRYEQLPDDVRIDALTLRAEVMVNGQWRTGLVIAVDSLLLPPEPERFAFDAGALDWETLFTDATAEDARDYFAQGFTLRNLEIEYIAFATFEPAPARPTQTQQRRAEERRQPRRQVRVYPVDLDIYIAIFGGLARPNRRYPIRVADDSAPRGRARGRGVQASGDGTADRTVRDNGGQRGGRTRGDSEEQTVANDSDAETGKTKRKKKKSNDDDDDDKSLAPVAIAAASVIVGGAILGGTVGYYGNTTAPFGLQGGIARPGGGAVLQAAVNAAVFDAGSDPKVIGKLTGFYNAFNSPIQPAVGLGAVVTSQGEYLEVEPTFSFGAVGQFGAVLLMGGYDVSTNSVDFGVAYNFKFRQ